MRDTDSLVKSSRHKKKKCRSPSVVSVEEATSESEDNHSNDVDRKRGHLSASDSSPERVKKHKKKRKKHKHKHKHYESNSEQEDEQEETINLSPKPAEEPTRNQKSRSIDDSDHEHDNRRSKKSERQYVDHESNVEAERGTNKRKDKRGDDELHSFGTARIKEEPITEADNRLERHDQSSSRHRSSDRRQRDRPEASDYHSSRRYHRRENERPREGERPRQHERDERDHSSNRRHNNDRSNNARHEERRETNTRHEPRERRDSEERAPQRSEARPGRGRGGRGGAHGNRGRRNETDETFEWGRKADNVKEEPIPPGEKEKPNFAPSGKLTEEANSFNGVVIKYSEPPEARKPRRRWRFYPFKGEKALQVLYIHRQSSYLIGRDRKIADIPVDHPSCSKQHAALQYRLVPFERENGTTGKRVRPYIIDLESANGTFVNNKKIDAKKYVELLERDIVKFGFSSREYVLLHEHSKDDDYDDIGELDESGEVAADA